ncbi:MAG: hypothetical protein K0R38_4668 [Polyangiaceae bacterium]|nr:hypothetical protein [Polyangiaceae bacterium]
MSWFGLNLLNDYRVSIAHHALVAAMTIQGSLRAMITMR